ncbi:MAG: hypothetical protein GY822_04685 [Deltaproteobacteria bacterium]|nr:hypothetical protein [Deltaproteobacteria bacterium]
MAFYAHVLDGWRRRGASVDVRSWACVNWIRAGTSINWIRAWAAIVDNYGARIDDFTTVRCRFRVRGGLWLRIWRPAIASTKGQAKCESDGR